MENGLGKTDHAIHEEEDSQLNYEALGLKETKRHCDINSKYISIHKHMHNSLALKAFDRKGINWFKQKLIRRRIWKNIN